MGGPTSMVTEPVPDGRRLRWTEHRTQRRAAFVAAGAAAIDRYGPGASAEQIADAAKVSRTVLYRYFRDRDDLRQAIADFVVRAVVDSVLPKLRLTPDATPHQIIAAALDVIVGWLDEHPNLYHFLRSRRTGASLDSVEGTLADNVAGLLKTMMVIFGVDSEQAEPGAYGIVGFVESAGSWWLEQRSMSRERFTDLLTRGVWHLIDGTARDFGVELGYDDPLPVAMLAGQGT
ncbi:MAG TPA: TetR family transcriptional regulator [Jatrophihabitans sp.]|nr:TetR family transcriptional regulator [Jatrophihabitans sp.]